MNRITEEALNAPLPEPEPRREGLDWIRTADGDIRHPLQHRCHESAMKVWHKCDELASINAETRSWNSLSSSFRTTGVNLPARCHGVALGRGARRRIHVAYLKRALDHLHQAQAGLEAVAAEETVPEKMVSEARKELFEIREGILKLMDEFRGRK